MIRRLITILTGLTLSATIVHAQDSTESLLRQLLEGHNTPEQTYSINQKLAAEFSSYSMDSTLLYLNRNRDWAREAGDSFRLAETDLLRAREYAMAGYHSDATIIFDVYQQRDVPEGLEYRYLETGNYLYGEIAAYSSDNHDYWQRRSSFRNGLMDYLEEGTYEYYDLLREAADGSGDKALAADYARKALDVTAPDSRDYARAAYFVSLYQPDDEARLPTVSVTVPFWVPCSRTVMPIAG